MIRKVFTASFIAASVLALTACNTVSGAGKDVASAGNAVSHTADKAK